MKQLLADRRILAWAFYDWANSAYATIVLAVFFPILFADHWYPGENSTTPLGYANAAASLLIVLAAPVLGAIADQGGWRKRFLLAFAGLGMTFTAALFFVAQGQWLLALAVYVLAGVGFAGANVFYDALIVEVAPRERVDVVSALGYALGYLGGGLVLVLALLLAAYPQWLGLDTAGAQRAAFLLTAGWWALFTLPLMVWVKVRTPARPLQPLAAAGAGLRQLAATFREVRRLRVVGLFLLAYWFYIDGVDTMVRMAIDYGKRLDFPNTHLILALLVTQFVGFPAAIAYGHLGERLGARRGIFIAIGVYVAVTVWGVFMDRVWEFYVLAVAVGLVQGGIQSLSRSLYTRLIPRDKSAEFFGFYNVLGKLAAVLGPVLMAVVSQLTGSPRLSLLSIILLFAAGGLLLAFVDEAEGARAARALEGGVAR